MYSAIAKKKAVACSAIGNAPHVLYIHECLWVSYDSLKAHLSGMNAYTMEIASMPTVPVARQARAMHVYFTTGRFNNSFVDAPRPPHSLCISVITLTNTRQLLSTSVYAWLVVILFNPPVFFLGSASVFSRLCKCCNCIYTQLVVKLLFSFTG
jgi:hypothetical protein